MVKGKALLFGLNYAHEPTATLNGCVNDVTNMASYLRTELGIPCECVTDDVDRVGTSAQGIVRKLYELAIASHTEALEFVWIHYSGHGSYVRDTSGDEKDRQDEALVPSDFKTAGLILDDVLQSLFRHFNPKTRVVCVFDCCHSGTIGDVKYCWETPSKVTIENIACRVKAKVMTISGCTDQQTSADAYNVLGDNKFVGALTSCFLMALKENPATKQNVFALIDLVRQKLIARRFSQYPKLCTTYNIVNDRTFIPCL